MSQFRLWPAVFVLAATVGASAHAAESLNGRWAEDSGKCSALGAAGRSLIVSGSSLRWQDEVCRIGRQYRTGDTVHFEAFCFGEGGERAIPVSLRRSGDRMALTWDRTSRRELRRCP